MDDNEMMTTQDYFGAIAHMVKEEATLDSVIEELRLARLKLGSVLDRLENLQLSREDLEGIRGPSDSIAFEVDGLVVLIRDVLDR